MPLVCPACRRRSERGLELSALAVKTRVRVEKPLQGQDADELVEGTLACTGCGRGYPVLDGIAYVFSDLSALLRTDAAQIVSQPLSPEVQALLAEPGPDDAQLTYAAESQGAYLDACWGDRATPPSDGPVTPFGFQALFERLRARAAVPVDRAVELGCGVGRGLAALKQGAKLVVGVDRSPGALKLARRILRGETTRVLRRNLGRTYTHATIEAGDLRAPSAQLVCADALEPPFAPGAFDRVAALNLLDVVREPRKLLHELHLMAAPRAELLLASPYAWRTGVVDEGQRLGEADPVAALHKEAHDLGWAVEQEDLRVPWILRRDARAASLYEVHWLRARRP